LLLRGWCGLQRVGCLTNYQRSCPEKQQKYRN